jgi:hypothetical protein
MMKILVLFSLRLKSMRVEVNFCELNRIITTNNLKQKQKSKERKNEKDQVDNKALVSFINFSRAVSRSCDGGC